MKKLIAISFLSACVGCSESPEDHAKRDAAYQLAKKECTLLGAKIALPGHGDPRENADKSIAAMEQCFKSRGFTVDMRRGTAR